MTKGKGRPVKNVGTVRSNLAALIDIKAKERGEKITISEIAAETRLATNTVKSYLNGEQDRFDGRTIAVLCQYLGCRIEDLLEIVGSDSEDKQTH